MTPDEREAVLAEVTRLLQAKASEELCTQLVDSGLQDEVWRDSNLSRAMFEVNGAMLGSLQLWALYLQHRHGLASDTDLLLPAAGRSCRPVGVAGATAHVDAMALRTNRNVVLPLGDDATIRLQLDQLSVTPIIGLAPVLGLIRVSGAVAVDSPSGPAVVWANVLADLRRIVTFELLGLGRNALGRAIKHVTSRRQFGRPIASFQAVRHRLAEAHVDLAGASALAESVDEGDDWRARGDLVRAEAGRAAIITMAAAQQVCGAMGFTDEFGLHQLQRRANVLAGLLGSNECAAEGYARQFLSDPQLRSAASALASWHDPALGEETSHG